MFQAATPPRKDETTTFATTKIQGVKNDPDGDFYTRDTFSQGHTKQLIGRGVYGDYILLLPTTFPLDPRLITDISLRFDYVSRVHQLDVRRLVIESPGFEADDGLGVR
jgi:hypothetical protein